MLQNNNIYTRVYILSSIKFGTGEKLITPLSRDGGSIKVTSAVFIHYVIFGTLPNDRLGGVIALPGAA